MTLALIDSGADPTAAPLLGRRKVSIVGFCESTRNLAPFNDPSFEIWGCNHLWPHLAPRADGSPAWDRWLDIHTPEWSALHLKPWAEHEAWLRQDHGYRRIYMQAAYPGMPSVVAYPLEKVIDFGARRYFTSAISYLIALAIVEGFEEIHLFGIDLRHDTEYGMQRPCAEYWMGRAEGAGVRLYVAEQSAVLSSDGLYGYEEQVGAWAEMDRALAETEANALRLLAEFRAKNEQLLAEMNTADGALQLARIMRERVRQRGRGGVL